MSGTKKGKSTKKSNTKTKTQKKTSKSTVSKKNNATVRKVKEAPARTPKEAGLIAEVYIWIALAIAILIFLSNFGLCGIIGNAISYFMFGLFGIFAYVFPIVLFVVTAFIASNIGKRGVVSRVIAFILLFTDMCMFAHLIILNGVMEVTVQNLYSYCGKNHTGGGLLGGIVGDCFIKLLGIVGTYIIIIVMAIVCIVLITQRSIMEGIKNYTTTVYNNTKQDMDTLRENRERKRLYNEEQNANSYDLTNNNQRTEAEPDNRYAGRRKRRNIVQKGVNFEETTIVRSNPSNKVEDVHEIDVSKITFEGLDTPKQKPVDVNEEETGQYTYFEPDRTESVNKPESSGGYTALNNEEEEDHSKDGEFTPKERIIVSREAKAAMSRKPYQTATKNAGDMTEIIVPGSNTAVNENGSDTDSLRTDNFTNMVSNKENNNTVSGNADNFQTAAPVKKKKKMRYMKPKLDLLNKNPGSAKGTSKAELMETATKLQTILKQFGVNVTITNVSKGPSVTRYELQPEMGTKVNKITSLADDIKLNLAAADIRIEAPIPGKAAVGIEVPNKGRDTVYIRDLIESKELRESKSKIAFAAGKDIAGRVVVADIAKMPHMLVAGTTGSGKSVFTNSIIMSILYRATPDEVKLIIIDPKVVEFGIYNGIPHLMTPVVTDPKKAAGALNWAVAEMSDRYKKFAASGTRDLKGYNEKIEAGDYKGDEKPEKLPQIVIIIDELADLMMVAAKDVESAICRLAQLARAAGIHLIIATQRPSVDVVTGLIKANIPSRVALLVSSGTDSRTIIDMNGAEKLLGNGDMLFYPSGYVKPVRIQGAFVSDEEVQRTVNYLIEHSGEVEYNDTLETKMVADTEEGEEGGEDGKDAYFVEAARLVVEKQKGSTSMIQRTFRVGFNRAARIMEQLYEAGIVGKEETNKPRKVLLSIEEFEEKFGNK